MKITVDLNVLLDVAQNRQPFYQSSEEVLHRARAGEFAAVLPAHALTTLHYIIEKWSGTKLANETIDGLLADFCNHSVGILGNHRQCRTGIAPPHTAKIHSLRPLPA